MNIKRAWCNIVGHRWKTVKWRHWFALDGKTKHEDFDVMECNRCRETKPVTIWNIPTPDIRCRCNFSPLDPDVDTEMTRDEMETFAKEIRADPNKIT